MQQKKYIYKVVEYGYKFLEYVLAKPTVMFRYYYYQFYVCSSALCFLSHQHSMFITVLSTFVLTWTTLTLELVVNVLIPTLTLLYAVETQVSLVYGQ